MKKTYKYLHEIEKETDALEAYQIDFYHNIEQIRTDAEVKKICAKCDSKGFFCSDCNPDIYYPRYVSHSEFYTNYGICKYEAEAMCKFPSLYGDEEWKIRRFKRKDVGKEFKEYGIVWDSEQLEWDMLVAEHSDHSIVNTESLHVRTTNNGKTFLRFLIVNYMKEVDEEYLDIPIIKTREISIPEANEWAIDAEPRAFNLKKHLCDVKYKKTINYYCPFSDSRDIFELFNDSLKWLFSGKPSSVCVHTYDCEGNKIQEV